MRSDHEIFDRAAKMVFYDAQTGVMTWRHKKVYSKEQKRWNSRYAGKECGLISSKGYRAFGMRVSGIKFCILVHRLAFFMEHGMPPSLHIDHIDGNKLNNKVSNLRDVSVQVNLQNRDMQKNNTSGLTGVRWRDDQKKWQGRVIISKKEFHLGYFHDKNEAHQAVLAFREKNGFTDRHGKDRNPSA